MGGASVSSLTGFAVEELAAGLDFVRSKIGSFSPRCGLVLGSGWGDVADLFSAEYRISYSEIPGMGATSVSGHSGTLRCGEFAGVATMVFEGRRHWYEGAGMTPVLLPIYLLYSLGAEAVVLTNAVGGVAPGLQLGELVVVCDHINLMGVDPLIGSPSDFWPVRFPDLTRLYDPEIRKELCEAATRANHRVQEGVYCARSGPAYETPAEIKMATRLGASTIGMSVVPEAIAAQAAEMRVMAVSCVTNLAAGISPDPLSHAEVKETTKHAMPGIKKTFEEFWPRLAELLGQRAE